MINKGTKTWSGLFSFKKEHSKLGLWTIYKSLLSLGLPRYSTRTRIFLSYSNSTRTKHYSDRVASSKTPRISTIIQKQPARRYFRIITANPDIQMQPSMEKMSSDLNVKKMEDVSKLYKLYFKNYMTHKFISSCPCSSATSGLSGR